jgi:hypothetical protein
VAGAVESGRHGRAVAKTWQAGKNTHAEEEKKAKILWNTRYQNNCAPQVPHAAARKRNVFFSSYDLRTGLARNECAQQQHLTTASDVPHRSKSHPEEHR